MKRAGSHHRAAAKPKPSAKPASASQVQKAYRQGYRKGLAAAKKPARKPAAPPKPKRRQLALADGLACCSAEALAASARLAGIKVSDWDVERLYWLTASDPDEGASIGATLAAAMRHGFAGHQLAAAKAPAVLAQWQARQAVAETLYGAAHRQHALILGAELPGSHAICLGPDGAWWSWGEPYDPSAWPGAVTEEAWAVWWQR